MNIQIDKSLVDKMTNYNETDKSLKDKIINRDDIDDEGKVIALSSKEYKSIKVDMSIKEYASLNNKIKELKSEINRLEDILKKIGLTQYGIDCIIPDTIFTCKKDNVLDDTIMYAIRFSIKKR